MTNRSRNAWITGAVVELVVNETLSMRSLYHDYFAEKWGLWMQFTFRGISLGLAAALSVAQGSDTSANLVSAWGQGALASISILTTKAPVVTAPAPVWFEATGHSGFNVPDGPATGETYDPSFHEITHIWTVRGQPLPAYNAPENIVTGWNNPNVQYGKRVAFCFPTPGTYDVDLWAIDSEGIIGEASASITVIAPEDAYSAKNTLIYSESGFSGAPAGTQISSISALKSAIRNANAPTRVRFKAGETVSDVSLAASNGYLTHIDSWGSGSRPILRPSLTSSRMFLWSKSSPDTQITFSGIKFLGYWDSRTETGVSKSHTQWNQKAISATVLLHDCESDGVGGWGLTANGSPMNIMLADTFITRWQNVGLYLSGNQNGRFALLGCRITQDPDALGGGPGFQFNNYLGPIRISFCRRNNISCCDLFSNHGWTGGALLDHQPCLRINTGGETNTSTIVDRVVMEGGYEVLNMEGENTATNDNPGNNLFDKVLVLVTANTNRKVISCHHGGTTFRNIMVFEANVPYVKAVTDEYFNFGVNNPQHNNLLEPISLYNNTVLSLVNSGNDNRDTAEFQDNLNLFLNTTEENNVFHAPNGSQPFTLDQPLTTSTTIPGITPRYSGYQQNYDFVTGTLGSSVANGSSFTVPYSNIGRQDANGNGPSGATDQAYWTANEATDTLHVIRMGRTNLHAMLGDFSVTFTGSGAQITNLTGSTWSSGTQYNLRLDRKTRLNTELPKDGQFASPSAVPEVIPSPASRAYQSAIPNSFTAWDDFYGNERTGTHSAGAFEP